MSSFKNNYLLDCKRIKSIKNIKKSFYYYSTDYQRLLSLFDKSNFKHVFFLIKYIFRPRIKF